jgi:prepilin-type N-terminal cleavage/methylation domain-containing protein
MRRGFTLAELLIAITVLGVIVSFTVPKILRSIDNTQNVSVAKSGVAQLEAAMRQGLLTGAIQPGSSYFTLTNFLLGQINAVKICPNNSVTQGCRTAFLPNSTGGDHSTNPGMVLHDGSFVAIWGTQTEGTCRVYTILYDVNHDAGPNSRTGADADVMELKFNLEASTTCGNYRPGTFRPHPTSVTAYQNLFTN